MKEIDVVYFLKPDPLNRELRYSLRSLEANLPHAAVWFYGGQPIEIQPDVSVGMIQKGANRYEKVRNMLRAACENPEITNDFWLFNDDFFILKPVKALGPWYNGELLSHARAIEGRHGGVTQYTRQLRRTVEALTAAGRESKNYAVHAPMRVNKNKMLKTLDKYPGIPMFRALYGNENEIGGKDKPDVKIYRKTEAIPEGASFVSTTDTSFATGEVGKQIRELFPEKSRWEV